MYGNRNKSYQRLHKHLNEPICIGCQERFDLHGKYLYLAIEIEAI